MFTSTVCYFLTLRYIFVANDCKMIAHFYFDANIGTGLSPEIVQYGLKIFQLHVWEILRNALNLKLISTLSCACKILIFYYSGI